MIGRRARWLSALAAMALLASGSAAGALQDPGVRDLVARLRAGDPGVRAKAACGLRELGDRAGDAVTPLIALLDDATPIAQDVCENNRNWDGGDRDLTTPGQQAASALVAIGSRSFTPLVGALQAPAWSARRNAAWALGALRDLRAVMPVAAALKDPEAPVRKQAAWALG